MPLFHSDYFVIIALFAIANGQHGYLPDTGILISALLLTASLHAKNSSVYVTGNAFEEFSRGSCVDVKTQTAPTLHQRYVLSTASCFQSLHVYNLVMKLRH